MAYHSNPHGYGSSNADLNGNYDYSNPFSDSNPRTPLASTNYGAQSMTDFHPYQDAPGSSNVAERNNNWMEPDTSERSSSGKRRWIIIGVVVVALIIAGVAIGVTLSKKNSSSNSSKTATDPSSFKKNTDLHQSFYGIAYTPYGSQLPNCGNSLADVITDIQLLSQLTTRIRLYGADCNQSALVLEAIKQTKVDMSVFLGNYPIATDNNAAYQRQRDLIKDAVQTYGTKNIAGITVGNEFMLNYLNANGATDPNSDVGNAGADLLIADIQDTRNMLSSLNLDKNIPVGTSDAGAYFNNKVLAAVDYGMANVHPWFANVSIDAAAGWTWDFFEQTDVAAANAVSNKPTMYIAETGWPTNSSDAGNASNGPSTASLDNLQKFMDTFVCQSNTNGTNYFFFEYFDETWKDQQFGGVEGWWGIFNSDRTLKSGLKIPQC